MYHTGKSEGRSKHERRSDGQRKHIIADEDDSSTKGLSSSASSNTHTNALHSEVSK